MHFLSLFSETITDFLFPKSEAARKLESLSTGEIVHVFPSPRPIEDDRIIAVFDYQDQNVRDMIWEIKYKSNMKLARSAAEIIYEILCVEISERALSENFQNPLLVPMPISDKKRRERGFNQTELICREIEKIDSGNLLTYEPSLLKKIRHTESQAKTHSKKERLQNLENSMCVVSKLKPQNYSVVLIDDVVTTGASIAEARRALRKGGFRKVLAITFAH